MEGAAAAVGRRILVDGMAGSGKSTFSRALSQKTGLPVIHLDVHYWQPGWVQPSEGAWRDTQRHLLAGDAWIADGNDLQTLDLRLERADTVVLLDTPWWTCACRAFMRGLLKPVGEMPKGCRDSFWRRLRDEWRLVVVILRERRSESERALAIIADQGQHAALHVLRSKRAARRFLGASVRLEVDGLPRSRDDGPKFPATGRATLRARAGVRVTTDGDR
jgi:adenylate kinase family enzyme